MTDQEKTKAREKALSLLADMDRTERQLFDRLKKAGFSDEVIEDTILYAKGYGFINDDRYAENYFEYYKDKRSKRRIEMDLRKKGLSSDTIDRAKELFGEYDERPLIVRMGRKKYASLKEDDPRRRQKLMTYLSGKGFRAEDIFDCAEEITHSPYES